MNDMLFSLASIILHTLLFLPKQGKYVHKHLILATDKLIFWSMWSTSQCHFCFKQLLLSYKGLFWKYRECYQVAGEANVEPTRIPSLHLYRDAVMAGRPDFLTSCSISRSQWYQLWSIFSQGHHLPYKMSWKSCSCTSISFICPCGPFLLKKVTQAPFWGNAEIVCKCICIAKAAAFTGCSWDSSNCSQDQPAQ